MVLNLYKTGSAEISQYKRCVCLSEIGRPKQLHGYRPGEDYPIYSEIPYGLSFTCEGRIPGYYSDPQTKCQVWHWCLPNGLKYSFLCPNGTVFNQIARVCDWWFNVNCEEAPQYYNINEDLYRFPDYGNERYQQR